LGATQRERKKPGRTREHNTSDATQSLSRLKAGERARVVGVEGGAKAERLLSQLQIRVGAEVELVRRAPMGGPVLVETAGCCVAVGKDLAGKVVVQTLS
jgi:ferrous iron transport protein A